MYQFPLNNLSLALSFPLPTISRSLVILRPSCCQRPHTLLESSLGEAAEVVEAPPTWKVPLLPPSTQGKLCTRANPSDATYYQW